MNEPEGWIRLYRKIRQHRFGRSVDPTRCLRRGWICYCRQITKQIPCSWAFGQSTLRVGNTLRVKSSWPKDGAGTAKPYLSFCSF